MQNIEFKSFIKVAYSQEAQQVTLEFRKRTRIEQTTNERTKQT